MKHLLQMEIALSLCVKLAQTLCWVPWDIKCTKWGSRNIVPEKLFTKNNYFSYNFQQEHLLAGLKGRLGRKLYIWQNLYLLFAQWTLQLLAQSKYPKLQCKPTLRKYNQMETTFFFVNLDIFSYLVSFSKVNFSFDPTERKMTLRSLYLLLKRNYTLFHSS